MAAIHIMGRCAPQQATSLTHMQISSQWIYWLTSTALEKLYNLLHYRNPTHFTPCPPSSKTQTAQAPLSPSQIMHAYSIDPSSIESISPVRHAPHWISPVTTRIAPDSKSTLAKRTKTDQISASTLMDPASKASRGRSSNLPEGNVQANYGTGWGSDGSHGIWRWTGWTESGHWVAPKGD